MSKYDIRDLIHTKYPIIQGGMANIADGTFAAAVANAGALGLIASGGNDENWMRDEIRKAKGLTDKPFGVNLMLMNPHADAISDVIVEEGVKFVTTGAGSPAKYMEKWKAAGIVVMPVIASVALGKMMARDGADALIAEGTESGGHVGEMSTMTLVPQVCDAIDLPIVAAGGIADVRQVKAAYALGACGVQIGTCLLVSEECPVHENYKQALIKAKDNATIVTGRSAGSPVRVLKNPMSREYLMMEKDGAKMEDLEKLTLGSLRRAVLDGDMKTGSVMTGQVCGQLKEVRPVADILAELWEGMEE